MFDIRKEAARTSVDSITSKLTRCIDALKVHVTPEGRLDEYDQHAVRILQSRIRFLERLFNYLYGTEAEKTTANIEMNLVARRDDGTVVQIGEKKHGQGRMDCRACDTEEIKIDGRAVQRIATRLCVNCLQGIQHTYTERMDPKMSLIEHGVGITIPDEVQNAPDARYGHADRGNEPILAVVQHRKCDNCGHDDLMLVGYEYPEPKKGRWRQVML